MEKAIKWRAEHCVSMHGFDTLEPGVDIDLGKGYWQGFFMKRNGDKVKAKKGVKFDSKRADWCTYLNFETMYDNTYKEMALNGIARKLDTPVKLEKKGEIVEHDHEAFVLPTKYNIIRPDRLLFVDEVGSNTSQLKGW